MQAISDHVALLIERGGIVMIPLFAMSVISLALILERAWFWFLNHRSRRLKTLLRLTDALRRGRHDAAETLAVVDRSPYGALASAMLRHGASDAVAVEAVEEQRPRLERFMVSLSTIITAAPLLGILGTVVGIIQSFRLLGEQQTLTDPREVAGGIAAALLTTALGLIVALLTLFPYMIFKSQMGRAMGRMESIIAAAQQGAARRSPATAADDAATPVATRV
ncbi:MAG: MotA/TolQ/ExbB proton channel family protein [Phycisphaerales bacterium]|nr:MotA/TolQ/ExbB proton channel family protein [Phycisphaerae bacterium]NNF44679.1 MotA/TolQ/ExbB proton channel family protein [Phycisphaerales bacterium]NNM27837.1 MotA/TolQ/ExbB proton channel family protein [Phycisphaerales bacterium]